MKVADPWAQPAVERFFTPATIVTIVRTIAAVVLCSAACYRADVKFLVASLAVYWIGDSLDGWVARILKCETRIGAVFDVLCDRLNSVSYYVAFMLISGGYYAATSVYLVEFAMLDCLLSLAFLASPVRSPNYYYVVNMRVWLLNWSKPAKVANSGIFAIAMLLGVPEVVVVVWALILLLLKVYSMRIVLAMGFKESSSIHYVG